MQNERDPEKNAWEDFKPLRDTRKETGLPGRLAILAFFCAAGALAGAAFGFFAPVMLARRRHRYDPMHLDRVLEACADTAVLRTTVGASAGALIAAVWILSLWRKAKRK